MQNSINETAAKRANDANSFSNYKEGSATAEYQAMVDTARQIAEAQKDRVDPIHHAKIDGLLATYCRKLADNINQSNAVDARVPSILITGGGNFPVRKKEQQNAARNNNMREWQKIQGLLDQIRSVGMGGISSDDSNCVEKLRQQLAELEAKQTGMKAANVYWRKHKTMEGCPGLSDTKAAQVDKQMEKAYTWVQKTGPFESWKLSNNNANIKRIRGRIADIERMAETEIKGWTFAGGRVVMNKEENRLQVYFDSKPTLNVRSEMKNNGFHWAPSQGAWQRQLTDNAIWTARRIKSIQPVQG